MSAPLQGRRRVLIDRLELDLRGFAPDTAEAAARALGPALARELAAQRGGTTEAGKPHDLATGIARQIAGRILGDAS